MGGVAVTSTLVATPILHIQESSVIWMTMNKLPKLESDVDGWSVIVYVWACLPVVQWAMPPLKHMPYVLSPLIAMEGREESGTSMDTSTDNSARRAIHRKRTINIIKIILFFYIRPFFTL